MPPPAAPTSTKEQVGAALQTAGQYAGGSTVWTPENAEGLGLDPERGYIAKGTPTDQPQPTLQQLRQELQQSGALPKPITPTTHPGLHGFAEQAAPPQQSQQPGPVPSPLPEPPVSVPTSAESDLKGAISEEEHAKGKAATSQLEGAVSEEEHAKEGKPPPQLEGAVSEEEHAKEAAAPSIPQKSGATAPTPAPQPPTPMPSGTGEGAPQGVPGPLIPGRDAHINALIASGKTPGEAQAIADGQEPKTVTGQKPQPKSAPAPKTEQPQQKDASGYLIWAQTHPGGTMEEYQADPNAPAGPKPGELNQAAQPSQPTKPTTTQQQPPKPIDTLKAGAGNAVDPVALYSYLLGKFAHSSVLNHPPPDGDFWQIKTGSAAEWAAFALAVAKQESDLNARSTNLADPGGSYGLFQFSQKGQPQYTNGEDQYDPQHSADAFVRAVEQLVGQKGKIANLGVTFGSIARRNEAGQYIAGAQKVAAGGSGKDLVSSGGDGEGPATGPGGPAGPWISVGGAPSGGGAAPAQFRGPPEGGGGGAQPDYSPSESRAEPISLAGLGGLLAAGVAAGSLFRGGGQPPAQHPAEEEPPAPPPAGGVKPANVLGVRTISPGPPPPAPSSLQAQLLPPPAAPTSPSTSAAPQPAMAPIKGPDPAVVKALMKRGFTRQQAEAFAAKATVSRPGAAAITGGTSFKPATQPAGAPPAKQAPPAPAPPAKTAPPVAAAPSAKQVPAPPQPREATRIGPEGSTVGVPNPPGGPSPDDPRVKKQKDNLTKGEHFVPGDDFHDQLLSGLPGGHGGRQRQILGQAEQAISDKSPLHISYISAPKEAEKFPTRESRKIQYDEHSPEARLMGTTEGQLVGHSMIPVSVGISPSRKAGEPHQSYIQGISTNILANNFQHVNDKLAAIGRKTPYRQLGQKFFNDLEGYYANLNAGHTATGRGYILGTEDHPSEPDRSHVPYKLSRSEADFIGTVLNNTAAFAKHGDAEKLRELARVNGTLITPEGETNRLRHEIEQHEPGWRQRVLEPSIRSFKTGLIHEVHPDEEHMPATIRPGKEFQDLTRSIGRTSERGRPDVPVAASLHHTFADNKAINQIERDFSQERISEQEARSRLKALGEDPDEFQFIGGSGGLITPYEENPEAITPEEHTELKTNLRKQWIGGKMPIEDYRRKAAEVPLPEKPSQPPVSSPTATEEAPAELPKPQSVQKPKLSAPEGEPEEPETHEKTPEMPLSAPKPAAPSPKPKPAAKAPQEAPEAPTEKPAHTFKEVTPEEFIAHRNKSAKPEFLSDLKPEEIQNHKLFTNQDNTIGAAVSPEGDIQNVFNNGGEKGAGAHAVAHAIEHHGGRTLDAYDGFLPDYYRQFGFHETGRTKFNPEFAPKWDTAKHGTPDVVHMGWGGHPEGGPEAAVARAKDKSKTNWIPNEQSTLYDDDFDAQKARSREFAQKAVGGGAKDYRTAGVEQGAKTLSARGPAQPGSGAAPRGPVGPPPAPSRVAKKGAKEPPPPRSISAATQKVLGPQPKNKKQAKLWQQAGERLDTQVPEGIPLEVDRGERDKFKTDPHGKVLYQKTPYDIANSPLLQKQGKALGKELNKKTGKMGMAKPPAETEDDLASLDPEKRLSPFLNPTDRKRVAHLNDISAVDAYADELHKMYKGIEDLPEVMKAKNWYDEAVDLLRHHFGSHADLMANLLGATSAGNTVKINFGMAMDAYHQFLRGHYDEAIKLYNQAYGIKQSGKGALMKHITDNGIHEALGEEAPGTDEAAMEQWVNHHNLTPRSPNGKLFGHNSIQVLKVLAHNWEEQAGGPKTPNFAANLNGRSMQATIDMWAARTMRRLGFEGHTDQPWMIQPAGETGVHNVDFGLSQLAFKKAADKIGIKPSALQAILWFAEQKEWQKRGWEREQDPDERDYRPMLKKYQRPGDITEAQAGKFHPSVPELEARLKGGVLHMQGGGLVEDPDLDPATGALANSRDAFNEEMANNPDVRQRLIDRAYAEVGDQSPKAWQAFIESSMNRGVARNQTLDYTISPQSRYFPNKTAFPKPAPKDFADQVQPYIDKALAGSNLSNLATGNQSPPVKSGGAPITFDPKVGTIGGGEEAYIRQLGLGSVRDDYETFVLEKRKSDQKWAAEMSRQQANPLPVAQAVNKMGGYGPENQPPPAPASTWYPQQAPVAPPPAPAIAPPVSPFGFRAPVAPPIAE